MFTKQRISITREPACTNLASNLQSDDFKFYDKDGFELNIAEQKFYSAMGYPIHHPILNHTCWQEPWLELTTADTNLVLDHCLFLCRCSYEQEAALQLEQLKKRFPLADYLLNTKRKWGFDFALDAIAPDGTAYEVIHIEYDHYDYDTFNELMLITEQKILQTDWTDCAKQVWQDKGQWQYLQGFEQNHWKSKHLLGWTKAEYTEKSI